MKFKVSLSAPTPWVHLRAGSRHHVWVIQWLAAYYFSRSTGGRCYSNGKPSDGIPGVLGVRAHNRRPA